MAIVSSNCSVVPAPNLQRLGGPSSNQPIRIPDLTRFITRSYPYYSVSGGAYGDIYKCVYHSGPDAAGDVQVAVKAFRSQLVSDEVFRRELGIWKRLRHPNILTLMGTAQGFCRSVALVAPWIVNGDLTSFLSKNNHTLCLLDRLLLLRGIAAGLMYLHTFSFNVNGHTHVNPVIHGDLTGNNVLIGSDRTPFLADFGLSGTLARLPGMTYLAMMSRRPGALRWTAPELLFAEDSASALTTQSDIYSFGSIMLQVLTGNLPWSHLTNELQMWQAIIERKKHPRPADGSITDRQWNFITSCWSITPINRPSAEEALQFIDRELALYDRGSVDGGQQPALAPVPGYTSSLVHPASSLTFQTCSQSTV